MHEPELIHPTPTPDLSVGIHANSRGAVLSQRAAKRKAKGRAKAKRANKARRKNRNS